MAVEPRGGKAAFYKPQVRPASFNDPQGRPQAGIDYSRPGDPIRAPLAKTIFSNPSSNNNSPFTSAFEGEYNAPKYTTGTVYQVDNAGNAYKTVGGPLSETEALLANRRKQRSDDNKQALLDQMAKDLANNPNAQYGRAPVPSIIPGASLANAFTGAGKTEEERKMLMENPGLNTGMGARIFGTGKYEPYDSDFAVVSDQVYASGVAGGRKNNEGMGDANENGLGRNMNYDRFGNERTVMPTNVPAGSTYWNSTTGNWTSKDTGLPVISGNSAVSQDMINKNKVSQGNSKTSNDSARGGK